MHEAERRLALGDAVRHRTTDVDQRPDQEPHPGHGDGEADGLGVAMRVELVNDGPVTVPIET